MITTLVRTHAACASHEDRDITWIETKDPDNVDKEVIHFSVVQWSTRHNIALNKHVLGKRSFWEQICDRSKRNQWKTFIVPDHICCDRRLCDSVACQFGKWPDPLERTWLSSAWLQRAADNVRQNKLLPFIFIAWNFRMIWLYQPRNVLCIVASYCQKVLCCRSLRAWSQLVQSKTVLQPCMLAVWSWFHSQFSRTYGTQFVHMQLLVIFATNAQSTCECDCVQICK